VEVWSQETEAVCEANGEWTFWGVAPTGSHTEAMMQLAEAVVHADKSGLRLDLSCAVDDALARVRDYEERT
jgi:hypothetical protein